MRKFFGTFALIAAAAITMVGCRKEAEEITFGRSISFSAEQESATKTVFGAPDGTSYPVLWTSRDKEIYISLNLAEPVKATGEASADGKTATFHATFPETSGSCLFVAISPASAYTAMDASKYTVQYTIPSTQTQEKNSPDQAAQILYGYASTSAISEHVNLHFGHVTAYMKVAFTGLDLSLTEVKSATVASDDVDLAGTIGYNPLTNTYSAVSGSKSVTVNTDSASEVWFAVNPCNLSSKSLTVTLNTAAAVYTKRITLPSSANLAAGRIATFSVDMSSATVSKPDRSSIKILAVGNSFSVDAMHYLYPILKEIGYSSVKLGDLYIGGCSLATHESNVLTDNAAYTYYTTTTGSWATATSTKLLDAVKSDKWDYISVQQASPNSGQPDTYDPYLTQLLGAIKAACPKAKIIWHMTWAYQANCNYSGFANYSYSEPAMYSAIVGAVKSKVLTRDDIDVMIPSGTAIANLRTSFIRENTSRDGYHLNYGVGRLTAAYMWAKQITGADIAPLTYVPGTYTVTSRELAAIKEAVNAAYVKPLEVTQATDTDAAAGYAENTALRAVLTAAGYNVENYTELPYGVTQNSYYNSTSSAILQHKNNGITASNLSQFAAVPYFFTKYDLPDGTLIVVDAAYQYRPEGWTALNAKTTSRPTNVLGSTAPVTKVDSSWWSNFTYRSFNISKIGNPTLSSSEQENICTKFAIFVPKN